MYHKIGLTKKSMWWVTVDSFYRQMLQLSDKKVVFLDEYDPDDDSNVVITFDGIYDGVFKYALPILKKFNYPFELFITGDYIGKDNSFDSPEPLAMFANEIELLNLVKNGGRLQWHTNSHPDLLNCFDLEMIQEELKINPYLLELDPKGFRWFGYPHGNFNSKVVSEVRKKFKGAVSCHQGNGRSEFELNRITVLNETTFQSKKITCVIASYNYGQFLNECVNSVLRQTYMPDQIIILDDYSNDETQDLGLYYSNKYKFINYIRNDENLGIVRNFSNAFKFINTELVFFLGADNRIFSNYVEECFVSLLKNPSAVICYTDFALFGDRAQFVYEGIPGEWKGQKRGEYFLSNFPVFNNDRVKDLEKRNFIHGSSMYYVDAYKDVGGYLTNEFSPEDHNLFIRLIRRFKFAVKSEIALLEYRQHSKLQANVSLMSYRELLFYKKRNAEYQLTIRAYERSVFWYLYRLFSKFNFKSFNNFYILIKRGEIRTIFSKLRG
ncbi:glycosyltransferase [Algoriphagus marincola]|uniref:glycosyltransferase n=1 Tax=Algoriphagus marincola TaxID=264027 RepID=UPI00040F9874|nr:glycosyltransferase [Algoriphagus marincola]